MTTPELTAKAHTRLIHSLERFGNRLNADHKNALFTLLEAMTNMAEKKLTGRWAFGLPTGTGKTRAIIEWVSTVHALNQIGRAHV